MARAIVVVVHEEVHRVGNVLGQDRVGLHGGRDDLVTAVARAEPVRLVEEAIAHAVVRVVDALGLRCLLHDRHHRAADRGHERVALGQRIARHVFGARLGDVACARVRRRELLPRVLPVEDGHVDHLLALEIGDAQVLALLHGHREPPLGRDDLLEDGTHAARRSAGYTITNLPPWFCTAIGGFCTMPPSAPNFTRPYSVWMSWRWSCSITASRSLSPSGGASPSVSTAVCWATTPAAPAACT